MLNGWDVDYQFCKNMVDGLGINASTMLGELRDSNRTSNIDLQNSTEPVKPKHALTDNLMTI